MSLCPWAENSHGEHSLIFLYTCTYMRDETHASFCERTLEASSTRLFCEQKQK